MRGPHPMLRPRGLAMAMAVAGALMIPSAFAGYQMIYKVSGMIETVPEAPESDFNSHTFTNCGQEGRRGPSLVQCQSTYSNTEIMKPEYGFNVDRGIQTWTVPDTGIYRIEALGAAGGHQTNGFGQGGRGASIAGEFHLTKGTTLKIVVGQQGRGGPATGARAEPAGGGGSFVYIDLPPADPLLIAGGGAGVYTTATTGAHGQASVNAGEAAATNLSYKGLPGQAGGRGPGEGSWITATRFQCSGGGAGWLSQGADGSRQNGQPVTPVKVGSSDCGGFGLYGRHVNAPEPFTGGYGSCHVGQDLAHVGGFGGAGGGGCGGEGGGGGYTGGAGTYANQQHGGGAGSFNGGNNPVNQTGVNVGHGRVTITKL